MSFDKDTRNALAKMVTSCRRLLTTDITDQLRGTFGLHPDGTVLPLEDLTHLTEDMKVSAQSLRELLDHFAAGAAGTEAEKRKAAYDRMVLEIAFTTFNRLAALRLCEERELVLECVRKGMSSDGFRLYESLSGGALGTRFDTYRAFLESLYDELAVDLGVLFDRTTPQSAVFPTERCLEEVLALLNDSDLAHLWVDDEAIGWVYQYFNPPEERKAMRDASQAPRNSRELAVRNQFFTPRYVVEFLTDNTLGRIWYEMRQGVTRLVDECRYLVCRPDERFLGPGEEPPEDTSADTDLTQQELLRKRVHIPYRPKKDPRDIKILDPACGSGHFLLYCFDLLLVIYEEAWSDVASPDSAATGTKLREDYPSLDDLRPAVPELVIRHNLHGIDIDPRCAQIAALALWLRAQRAYAELGINPGARPQIRKSNIVVAEPMPGEEDLLKEFTATLQPKLLGQLVEVIFEKMKLAGEAGALLKIEEELTDAIVAAKKQWVDGPTYEQELFFFAGDKKPKVRAEQAMLFDVSGVSDAEFWQKAERLTIDAIHEFAGRSANGAVRRKLFSDDAEHGFAFVDLSQRRYDVALMNPPFGDPSSPSKPYIRRTYPRTRNDVYAVFVERLVGKLHRGGMLGAITSRTGFFLTSFRKWREEILLKEAKSAVMADLGYGVLDAKVETAAYCLVRAG